MPAYSVFMTPKKTYAAQLPSYYTVVEAASAVAACYCAKVNSPRIFNNLDQRYKNAFAIEVEYDAITSY